MSSVGNSIVLCFGFGLGIDTKTGLFKLNYAYGFVENQLLKFSDSKIHINLNAIF